MNNNSNNNFPAGGLVAASLVIGVCLIISTILIGSTLVRVKGMGQTISVTGAAYKPIMSNFAIWSGAITATNPTLDGAYDQIESGLTKVRAYMKKHGFEESEYGVKPISISKDYNRDHVFTGYTLRQQIEIELDSIQRVTELARNNSSLIEQGVEFLSYSPRYMFTGLDSLKLEMIEEATENARLRAEMLAGASGMKVGSPRSARVGVFQIRPRHSQEVSDYGINDQTSIEKEIVCTVHINFLIR